MEMTTFISLVRSGWTNLEIQAFAYQHGLSRYMEEFREKSPYGDLTLAKARKWVDTHPLKEEDTTPPLPLTNRRELSPPEVDGDEGGRALGGKRLPQLRWLVLKEVDGSRPSEIYERLAVDLKGQPGSSERNLQRQISYLERDGFVDRVKGEDGVDDWRVPREARRLWERSTFLRRFGPTNSARRGSRDATGRSRPGKNGSTSPGSRSRHRAGLSEGETTEDRRQPLPQRRRRKTAPPLRRPPQHLLPPTARPIRADGNRQPLLQPLHRLRRGAAPCVRERSQSRRSRV